MYRSLLKLGLGKIGAMLNNGGRMKKEWHKYALIFAGSLAILSLGISIYFWPELPSTIPTHFGFNGQPDSWADKSIFYAFMIPFLQLVLFLGFIFLYSKPQYSDMPTTLLLMAMPEDKKEHAFDLIRTMLVIVTLWMGALFTYLNYGINASAMGNNSALNPWIMGALMLGLFVWLAWYTVKVYKYTRKLINNN